MVKFKTIIRAVTNLADAVRDKNINANVYDFLGANKYEVGDRVAQLIIIPIPEIEFVEVDELSESERGSGGYGSTGR